MENCANWDRLGDGLMMLKLSLIIIVMDCLQYGAMEFDSFHDCAHRKCYNCERLFRAFNCLIKFARNLPGKDVGIVSSGEGLFELFQLETGKCRSISALFTFLWIFTIQINITVIGHWTVTTQTCCSTWAVIMRRSTLVRYLLEFRFLWYAHTGRMKWTQSIDVGNFYRMLIRRSQPAIGEIGIKLINY